MKVKNFLVFVLLLSVAASVQLISIQSALSANPNCTVPNCLQCLTINTTCDLCDNSYYLQNNVCLSCSSAVANCQECTFDPIATTVTCSLCSTGFVLVGQTCTSCSLSIPYCTDCTSTTTCTACAVGSYLFNGVCTLCTDIDGQCTTCFWNGTNPECTACTPDYYYLGQNNLCLLCSANIQFCLTCV